MSEIRIGERLLGDNHPVYFVADIASNHDAQFERAIKLIEQVKEAGADAAKFQLFDAKQIVSRKGFANLQVGHQTSWPEGVYATYEKYSLPPSWLPFLSNHCKLVGLDFLCTPYDLEAVDMLDPFVPAYKIGSGDIDWLEL